MNTLPRSVTVTWETACRRCQTRVLGAFDQAGQGLHVEAEPVCGGDIELRKLEVGFRAVEVKGSGDVERYVRHRCAKAEAPKPLADATPEDDVRAAKMTAMPFGKHRGEYLDDIPAGYLRWALENCAFREPAMKRAIETVLKSNKET